MADIREVVSGIGKDAKRTDLNVSQQPIKYISGMPYGQGQATYNQQASAPMYANPLAEVMSVTPITAATERKNEAVTTGIDMGPGAGSEVLPPMPVKPTISLADTFRQIAEFDPSGDSELVYRRLVDEGY
jgi:hypothetical protein